MTTRQRLCHISEVPDPGSRGFVLEREGEMLELFLVRKDQAVYAYQNSCPHTGSQLDWLPHQFLDIDSEFIQCATHAALFQIETGQCVSGPCAGERLTALKIVIEDEAVWLEMQANLFIEFAD